MVAPCVGVAITHDLSVIQVPAVPHQYEQVTEGPAWIGVVCRRVCETYKSIFTIHFVEKALLVGFKSAYGPGVSKLLKRRDWRFWPLLCISPSLYALRQEEASLADV